MVLKKPRNTSLRRRGISPLRRHVRIVSPASGRNRAQRRSRDRLNEHDLLAGNVGSADRITIGNVEHDDETGGSDEPPGFPQQLCVKVALGDGGQHRVKQDDVERTIAEARSSGVADGNVEAPDFATVRTR